MSSTEHLQSPDAGLKKRIPFVKPTGESRSISLTTLTLGWASILIPIVGSVILFISRGLDDFKKIAASINSTELWLIAATASALGLVAIVLGLATYKKVDTKKARNQSITGALLGLQALVLSGVIFAFNNTDATRFAQNFLNFPQVINQLHNFWSGAMYTIILATASAVFGLALGMALALLAVSQKKVLRAPARIYVNVVRGTPLLLQLSLIYFGMSLGLGINMGVFPALVLGLSLHVGAYASETLRAGLQSVEKGQLEAARGLGLTYGKSMRLVVIPQGFRRVIPPLMNEYIGLIKDTSLVAFLGVSLGQRDLFSVASQGYAQFFNSTFYIASGIAYLVITIPLIMVVTYLERRMRNGR